jgi:hypothetical protein
LILSFDFSLLTFALLPMSYIRQLHLPNRQQLDDAGVLSNSPQSSIVERFRRRDDAVAYLQVLQKSTKNVKFLITFDVQGV